MRQLDPKTLTDNVFQLFDDRWTLITAGDRERCNTMTASWGGLGVLWNRPVATIYVRPQRYTYEFLEDKVDFTLHGVLQHPAVFHPLAVTSGGNIQVNVLQLPEMLGSHPPGQPGCLRS